MVGVIDLLGLLNRSVVKPQDDISIVAIVCEIGTGDREGLVGIVSEDSKRAGGIEANSLDAGGVDSGFADHTADAFADALPNIRSRLFLDGS